MLARILCPFRFERFRMMFLGLRDELRMFRFSCFFKESSLQSRTSSLYSEQYDRGRFVVVSFRNSNQLFLYRKIWIGISFCNYSVERITAARSVSPIFVLSPMRLLRPGRESEPVHEGCPVCDLSRSAV